MSGEAYQSDPETDHQQRCHGHVAAGSHDVRLTFDHQRHHEQVLLTTSVTPLVDPPAGVGTI